MTYDPATLLAEAATSVAVALRADAALETDPARASKLLANAAIASLVPALMDHMADVDGDTILSCLAVMGRLLANPDRLFELAPDLFVSTSETCAA